MDNNYIFAAWLGIVIIVAFLVPYILYLVTLQNTLKTISPVNRQMEPGRVWLLLIPVFNLIWNFIVAAKLADSLEAEYSSRGGDAGPRPTYNLGLAVSILWCCGAL